MQANTGKKCLLTFLCFLVLGWPSAAQESGMDEDDKLFEELLNAKISTAAKYEQSVSEAPASVTIITCDEIEQFGYRTVKEVLMSIRGFYLTDDRNYTYLGVRGFSRPSDYNNRILLLIDGHSMAENIWGSVDFGIELGLDLESVERIEIVRGPGAALYGANAMLAVINIITRKGGAVNGFKSYLQAGSFGQIQAGMCYGKEFNNGLDVLVSGFTGRYDGPDLYFQEYDDPSTHNGIARGLDWERYSGVTAKIDYKNFSLHGLAAGREKGIPTASYETIFNDDRTWTYDARYFVELKYEKNLNYKQKFMVRGHYNRYTYRGKFPYDLPDYQTVEEDRSEGEWLGIEGQFNWDIGPGNRLILGAEYKYNSRAYYRLWDEFETLFDRDIPFDETSFYLQDEHQFLKNLSLTVGLRYDKYSDRDESLSPRAALVFDPFKGTTIKLLYGSAYRAPNIYELYYEIEDDTKANPLLDNERINTLEAVVEQKIGKRLAAIVSVYRFEMRELIDQQVDETDGLWQFRNVEKVRGTGIELGLNLRSPNGVRGYLEYNYQMARDVVLDERISNSPAHGLKLGISFPLVEPMLLSLEVLYESGRITVYNTRTGPYFLVNGHLFSKDLFGRLEFSLQVKNLFDVDYQTPGGFEHFQPALTQNGRTFSLRLRYRF